jgi:hypothetical protein
MEKFPSRPELNPGILRRSTTDQILLPTFISREMIAMPPGEFTRYGFHEN